MIKYNVIAISVYNILLRVQFHTLSNTGVAKQTPCTSRQTSYSSTVARKCFVYKQGSLKKRILLNPALGEPEGTQKVYISHIDAALCSITQLGKVLTGKHPQIKSYNGGVHD